MAAIYPYLKENDCFDTIPRFSKYTQEQIELLIEHCGLTLIRFEEVEDGLRIYLQEPVTYLDFLNELNRLLSNVEDVLVKFEGMYTLITCIYHVKTIEVLNEDKYTALKNSLKWRCNNES